MLSGKKNAVPGMQVRGASVKEEKESCSAEKVGVNAESFAGQGSKCWLK